MISLATTNVRDQWFIVNAHDFTLETLAKWLLSFDSPHNSLSCGGIQESYQYLPKVDDEISEFLSSCVYLQIKINLRYSNPSLSCRNIAETVRISLKSVTDVISNTFKRRCVYDQNINQVNHFQSFYTNVEVFKTSKFKKHL